MIKTHKHISFILFSALLFLGCSEGNKEASQQVETIQNKTSNSESVNTVQDKTLNSKAAEKQVNDAKFIPSKKEPLNLAGLSANMTVEEVKNITEKRGFKPNILPEMLGPSFEQVVDKKKGVRVSRRDHKTTKVLLYKKEASQETLAIEFIPFEKGPQISGIVYRTEAENMSDEIFLARAIKKYGEPDSTDKDTTWLYVDGNGQTTTITLEKRTLYLINKDLVASFSQLVQDKITNEINDKPADTTF